MELTLYLLLAGVAFFLTYLSYSKDADQTDINKMLAGTAWFALGLLSFSIRYYIPNGSVSSYTQITDVSEYWQLISGLFYSIIGIAIWYQLSLDRVVDPIEEGMM